MAKLTLIGIARTGGSVSVDRRLGILRIENVKEETTSMIFGPNPQPLQKNEMPGDVDFSYVVDVPPEVDWSYEFYRLDFEKKDTFPWDPKIIDAVNKGYYYGIDLTEVGHEVFGLSADSGLMVILLGRERRGKRSLLISIGPGPQKDIGVNERVIAVLDLLGYKNIILSTPLKKMSVMIQELLSFIKSSSKLAGPDLVFGQDMVPDPNVLSGVVSVSMISDTVIIQAESGSAPEAIESICRACALILDFGLFSGWLFRGCIEVGEFMALDAGNVFIGKALVTAYEIEQTQQWSGCAFSPSVIKRFPAIIDVLSREGLVVPYNFPVKNEGSIDNRRYALNWCVYSFIKDHDREAKLQQLLQGAPDDNSRTKVLNTLEFVREIKNRRLESSKSFSFQPILIE